ncbi:hypothetical protein BJ742DRAFT_878323 [Cladochytrium replicatum]|nr:hypothetical protein BJ742DRAFT_878323 [Cladochytrium replicatum]
MAKKEPVREVGRVCGYQPKILSPSLAIHPDRLRPASLNRLENSSLISPCQLPLGIVINAGTALETYKTVISLTPGVRDQLASIHPLVAVTVNLFKEKRYVAMATKLALVAKVIGMTLAFLDIGANIGWFTFNMAAAGPLANNHVRQSFTNAYYPVGLGQTESTSYIVHHIGNVGDGFAACDKVPDFRGTDEYPIRGVMQTKILSNMLAPYTCTDLGCANPGEWTETQFGLRGTPPLLFIHPTPNTYSPS